MDDRMIDWLLSSDEPWTRYRTRLDLLEMEEREPAVVRDRELMMNHPRIIKLLEEASSWPGYALKRHSDAKQPLYALSTLADFGLRQDEPRLGPSLDAVLNHQSQEGPFQIRLRLYKQFGGLDGEYWTWMACDAPTIVYALMCFGLQDHPGVKDAFQYLIDAAEENGWRCSAAEELGSFKGPGKREDPCPIATTSALKAISLDPSCLDCEAAHRGVEMLLQHWEDQEEVKYFLFGIGTDFRKLKYPYVWYNILHVAEAVSRFPFAREDARFQDMLQELTDQADPEGKYTAASMYRHWKEWSFADKKQPSPWLTFLVRRIQKRVQAGVPALEG